jgi:hypothetical protein
MLDGDLVLVGVNDDFADDQAHEALAVCEGELLEAAVEPLQKPSSSGQR